jgi:hypothetical protein
MRENPAVVRFFGVREGFSRVELLQNIYSDFRIMSPELNLGEFTPPKPACSKG